MAKKDRATVAYDLLKTYDDEMLAFIEAVAALKLLHQLEGNLQRRFSRTGNDRGQAEVLKAIERISKKRSDCQANLLRSESEIRKLRHQLEMIQEE